MNRKLRRLQRGLLGACLSAGSLAAPGLAAAAPAAGEAPITTRDFVAAWSGETVTVDVTSNDWDKESFSEELVVTEVGATDAYLANTAVSLVDGEVQYTAPAGFYGSDSFAYLVKDESGNTTTGTVHVFVYPHNDPVANDPGLAKDDYVTVVKGGSVTINPSLNDVDPEGDAVAPIENVNVANTATLGTVTDDGTTVTYTSTGAAGTDSFSYQLPDGGATGTVHVTVVADNPSVDQAPVPSPDRVHTFDREPFQIDVLANDADPEGGALTLTGASIIGLPGDAEEKLPAPGSVSLQDNFVIFQAEAYTGSVQIAYTVEDSDGLEAKGFAEVLVTPMDVDGIDDAPIANPDLATVRSGQTVRVPFRQNDVDADGAPAEAGYTAAGVREPYSRGGGDDGDDNGPDDPGTGTGQIIDNYFQYKAPKRANNTVITVDFPIQNAGGAPDSTGTLVVLVLGNGGGGGTGGGGTGPGTGPGGGGGPGPITPFVRQGYRLVASDGGVFTYGGATFHGSTGGINLNQPIVGLAGTKSDQGYWLVASDGGIFSFGDAQFLGSTGAIKLNKPIVGMAVTPSGLGYWLVASDGGIFTFGDAGFFGSTGAIKLNKPIVGMAATPSGQGYWLVASDGGIFSFGDATFYGSTGAIKLNQPIAGMTSSPTGGGYQLVAEDGGVFSFGNAGFLGSLPGEGIKVDVAALAPTPTGLGYYVVATDGRIFAFGDAKLAGAPTNLNKPIVGIY